MFCGPCTKFLVALISHLSMFAIEIDIKQRILQVEKEFHALLEEFNHLIATEQTSEPRWSRRGKQLGSANAVQSEWLPFQQSLHNVAQQLLEIVGIPEHLGRPDG